ncbi:hypothetical protein AB0F17_06375 [Nonomuraea sp. NPDC026600]|uniref:hypothetical protein n=1 Tax=Nonomuraea sp. NPDC026600 TaxID=3155363 RepID=UPI00340684E8
MYSCLYSQGAVSLHDLGYAPDLVETGFHPLDGASYLRDAVKADDTLYRLVAHHSCAACIRCPMLHVDPKMLDRLAEIETDLLSRRARAEAEGWLGELEGLDLTLNFLAGKREEARRLSRTGPVSLGLLTPRDPA